MQRWLFIGDLHSGSPVGLTDEPQNTTQQALLDRYMDALSWFGDPPDVVVVNGDMTEGIDRRFDVTNPLLLSQMASAANCVALAGAKTEYILITGTTPHTSVDHIQEMEYHAAPVLRLRHFDLYKKDVKVSITRKLNTTINGWFRMQARHYIGRSMVPYSRATAPMRSKMWQELNEHKKSVYTGDPVKQTHLLIFGHVHYYISAEDATGRVMTLPSWKALGDKFGDEKCDGSVDLGIVKLEIGETQEEGWGIYPRLYHPAVVSRLEHR